MIQNVLEAIKAQLQSSPFLSSVKTYHLVDGMIPGSQPTISIGCGKMRYQEYSPEQDEVHAPVRIYVYVQDIKAERGEQTIRYLATEIRYTLLEDIYLGGLVDSSTVTDINFESEQVNQSTVLHYAVIDYEVVYYEPRKRPDTDQPLLEEINATFNSADVDIPL